MNDPIAGALCSNCQREAQIFPHESIAKILVTVPHVPSDCSTTHAICPSCLELHQPKDRHAERCELGLAGIALECAGWGSPLSEFLRKDLRRRRPRWMKVVATLLSALVEPFAGIGGLILVPIPVSGRVRGQDGLVDAVSLAGERNVIPVVRAVVRKKHRSTRHSGAQVRRRIVEEEYGLDAQTIESIRGSHVILVDDTVTTGTTMAGIAKLLRNAGARAIAPISLDRTVSARLQQRLSGETRRRCAHIAARSGE